MLDELQRRNYSSSRLRGGGFACNTPGVMPHAQAVALIYLFGSYLFFGN
jgi:hypothetical protein